MIGVHNLSVHFGAFTALDGVDMQVRPGMIQALAGENGSGKSTLLKVLGGAQAPHSGTVMLDGKAVSFANTTQAASAGIGLIYQELSLFPHLSGYSNIFIGNEPRKSGFIHSRRMRETAESLILDLGFPKPPLDRPVAELSVAEQQVIEILKCLSRGPKIILFDEPTASLTQREAKPVLNNMRCLRNKGYTVVFVSHYLEEVFAVADQITVLRDGRVTLDKPMSSVDRDLVLEAMLGRKLMEFYPSRNGKPTDRVLLKLDSATCAGIKPVSLNIRKGEILGVAGTVGSGSAAFAEMIGGIRSLQGGTMSLDGRPFAPRNPAQALRAGIAYVPEDRRTEALLLDLSVATNISLPLVAAPESPLVGAAGFLLLQREHRLVLDDIQHMNVRPPNSRLPARALSGGNQQKIVLGRWFLYDRPCLVLNNPTKGIDIGSKAEIYKHIMDLAESGHAIIMISNYNPEIIGIADRIIVFREGRLVKTYRSGELTEDELLDVTMGGAVEMIFEEVGIQ